MQILTIAGMRRAGKVQATGVPDPNTSFLNPLTRFVTKGFEEAVAVVIVQVVGFVVNLTACSQESCHPVCNDFLSELVTA